jgi:hypothetical protein
MPMRVLNALYERTQNPLTEAACWAHARRKLYEIYRATDSPIAREALERIGALYHIEEQIRGHSPQERQVVRQARAGPLLESLYQYLIDTVRTLSKKSELAGAIRYALSRWKALTRYRDDGRIEIDNSAAERALRAVALGRNYERLRIMRGCAGVLPVQCCRDARQQHCATYRKSGGWVQTAHNHRPLRNCISRSDGRKRTAFTNGGCRDFNVFSFIARSAST